jgi:hypothetical protein
MPRTKKPREYRHPVHGLRDARLVCCVMRLEYDFRTRTGAIYFPDGRCCDMAGCVALFEGIDPGVRDIQTYSGEESDTRYRKGGDGEWHATMPVHGRY